MGLLGNLFKREFDRWLEDATHDELSTAYERERQNWIENGYNNGTGEITEKMKRISNRMSSLRTLEIENDPDYKRDPNYRWTDENRWE